MATEWGELEWPEPEIESPGLVRFWDRMHASGDYIVFQGHVGWVVGMAWSPSDGPIPIWQFINEHAPFCVASRVVL